MAPRFISWFVFTAFLAVCVAQHEHTMSGPSMHGTEMHGTAQHNMAMNSTAPALPIPNSCVTDPTQTNCTAFKYPHKSAVADLNALCTAMSFMAACSVKAKCAEVGAGPDNVTSPTATQVSSNDTNICRVLHQVATVCRHDTGMSKMKGCSNFNTMCAEGSNVPQCANFTGISILPTTRALNTQVRSICEEMPGHTGCDQCLPSWQEQNKTWGNCDLLAVYASVCSEMPSMPQCNDLRRTCKADPSLWICAEFAPAAASLASKADNAAAGSSVPSSTAATAGNTTSAAASGHGTKSGSTAAAVTSLVQVAMAAATAAGMLLLL